MNAQTDLPLPDSQRAENSSLGCRTGQVQCRVSGQAGQNVPAVIRHQELLQYLAEPSMVSCLRIPKGQEVSDGADALRDHYIIEPLRERFYGQG